ncbi:hypothetical protein QTP88_026945 [Uroleucon formosanum]
MSEKRKSSSSSSSILSYFKKSNNSINDQNDIDETLLPSTVQIFESIWNQFLNIHGLNGRFANREAFIGKLQGEVIWRKEYWNREKIDIPDTALKSLEHCDKDMFPTIHILLKILASFPISIASAERSFSTRKRIKTWLRCNMLEERLSGLAIIYCHRDKHVDIDEMTRSTREYKSDKTGKGFVYSLINSLPFEAHVPGYQYCGPGTKLKKRLDRSDEGINPLDAACNDHNIVYATSKNLNDRHKADKVLENRAWERFKAEDSSRKEKLVAYAVTNVMKAKRKIGMGGKRKRVIKNNGMLAAKKKRTSKKKNSGKRLILTPEQSGGVIPLIPIFAGLSALGSLMSGGASVYNEVQNSKRKKDNESYYKKSIRNPILSPTFLSNAPIIVIDTSKQNDSATASAVDVQLEIEASESVTGVTAYCLLIHDRIVEYVPFTREVTRDDLFIFFFLSVQHFFSLACSLLVLLFSILFFPCLLQPKETTFSFKSCSSSFFCTCSPFSLFLLACSAPG